MSLVEDLQTIGQKIVDTKAANPEILIDFSFSEISVGNDFYLSITVPNMPTQKLSSTSVSEILSYMDAINGAVVPESVPQIVSPRQIRLALVTSGISIDTVESFIDSLPDPDKSITRVTWEYSKEFHRTNPILNSLAPALGLSSSQVDDLFKLAATL